MASIWRKALNGVMSADQEIQQFRHGLTDPSTIGNVAGQVAGSAWNHVISPVGSELLNSTHPKMWGGDIDYQLARSPIHVVPDYIGGALGIGAQSGAIKQAYEKGYNGYTGGRAVWEREQAGNPGIVRGVNDIGIDPVTYASLGTGAIGENIAKAGTDQIAKGFIDTGARDVIAGRAKYEAGKAIQGVSRIYDVPNQATDYVAANVIGKLAATRPGGWIAGISEKEAVRKQLDTMYSHIVSSGIFDRFAKSNDLQEQGFNKALADVNSAYTNKLSLGSGVVAPPPVKPARMTLWKTSEIQKELKIGFNPSTVERDARNAVLKPQIDAWQNFLTKQKAASDALYQAKKGGGNFARVGQNTDQIVQYAGQQVAKGKPITEAHVGDRTWQWGENAGKSMVDVANAAATESKTDRAFLDSVGLGFKQQPKKAEIKKAIDALTPDQKDQVSALFKKYTEGKVNPLTANSNDMFRHVFKSKLVTDTEQSTLAPEVNDWLHVKLNSVEGHPTRIKALQTWGEQATKDKATLIKEVGADAWGPRADPKFIQRVLETNPVAKKAYNNWSKIGIDILHAPVPDAAFNRLSRAVYSDAGVYTAPKQSFFRDLATVWKGQALLSPRYHESNITSAWFNNILVNGLDGTATPREYWTEIQHSLHSTPEDFKVFGTERLNQTLSDLGRMAPNTNLTAAGLGTYTSNSQDASERLFRKILGENIGAPIGKTTGRVMEWNRRIGAGIDAASRGTLWDTKIWAGVNAELPKFQSRVAEVAAKQGLTIPTGVEIVPFKDPAKLLGFYRGLGFTDGNARRLSMDWASVVNEADKSAMALVHKAHFSYYKSSADELISKVMPFHYYASRASRLYVDEMMRNPVLLLNFSRLSKDLESGYKNGGLNGRQKGWLYVMGGPAGFTLLANPDALFGFTRAMGLMGDGYKSDQTQLGGILNFMKAGGFGLYPIYDNLFNVAGTYGNTFEPDFLGIRHRALVGSLINGFAGQFHIKGLSQDTAPYAEINADLRAHASEFISHFAPGWLATPVPERANSTGTIGQATTDGLIESRVMSDNPGMTHQQLFDIMNNEDSPQYQKAWEEVSRSGAVNQLLSFMAPIGLKFRDAKTDVRNAQIATTYDYADKYNIPTSMVNPATDAQFAKDYKLTTGSDWKPGDFDKAMFQSRMANSTVQGRMFIMNDEQYRALGSTTAKAAMKTYYSIVYDGVVPKGFVPPEPGKETTLAKDWLSTQPVKVQNDVTQMQTLQDSFKLANPDFAQFKDWSGKMGSLKKLLGGSLAYYREQVSAGNPNAARFFQNQVTTILANKKYKTAAQRAAALDDATTTVDAWMAINGIPQKVKDARALPTATQAAPAYTGTDQMLSDFKQGGSTSSSSSTGPSNSNVAGLANL